MRPLILLAGPALLLAACGTNDQAENTINVDQNLSAESFSSNDVTAIDAVTGDASNMAADVNYVTELDNLAEGNAGSKDEEPASSKAGKARRSAGNSAASNSASPEPASNSTSTATANNAL